MNYAVIMAGGTGTRFWPVSRMKTPKQLLVIGGDETLLEQTVHRIQPLVPAERIMVVTGDAIAEESAAILPPAAAANLVSEPCRRNTAPCAAVAAKILVDRDPDAVVALLPADHAILKAEEFLRILSAAMTVAAREDVLITLGITARRPDTGFGYIEIGGHAGREDECDYHYVTKFHEKPEPHRAKKFAESGRYFWNAGIFVFRADTLLRAVAKTLPDLYEQIGPIDGRAPADRLKAQINAVYPALTPVSIDVGVMEKVDNLLVFPADIGWSDVGSWTALRELFEPDTAGNVTEGRHVAMGESRNNTVYAKDGVVVTIGVDDLIIVHTPDATLVARRDQAQEVKHVFDELEKHGWDKYR
ncbi:MAG: sugar phosphate nucleotidyltransferase [Candidatus Lernaella stagnicola]|nr:sugar phosphate nucleotidyltransferase [Candidatus Lernaella stagnicola]